MSESKTSVNRPGFSLLEVLIALIILAVGMLAMISAMASNMTITALTNSRMDMVTMAESKVEELRWYAVSNSADTVRIGVGGSLTSNVANYFDTIISQRGRTFVRRWSVVAGPGGTRQVTLRILPQTRARVEVASLDFNTLLVIER